MPPTSTLAPVQSSRPAFIYDPARCRPVPRRPVYAAAGARGDPKAFFQVNSAIA